MWKWFVPILTVTWCTRNNLSYRLLFLHRCTEGAVFPFRFLNKFLNYALLKDMRQNCFYHIINSRLKCVGRVFLLSVTLLFVSVFAMAQEPVEHVSGIKVVTYEGLRPYLEKDNDTAYILNFWATWCAPCIKELPHFEKLAENYRNEKMKLILVSLDFRRNIESRLIPFIEKNQLKSEVIVLSDPASNVWIDKVEPTWSGAIPATIFYNKDRRVFMEQELTYEKLEEVFLSFINKP